jgi:hypothetical protein
MARQDGVLLLKGELGGLSFYKTNLDGHLARQKGGVDAKRIRTDPSFARTRENGEEFGRAGQAGRLLRTAFRGLVMNSSDGRVASRLTRKFSEIVHSDTTSLRGKRNVADGDMSLLRGFDFNIDGKLRQTLLVKYGAEVDRTAGTVAINLPNLVPARMVIAPEGATNFRLVASVAEFDFAGDDYNSVMVETEEFPIDVTAQLTPDLSLAIPQFSGNNPVVVVLGIEFSQVCNGALYPLNDGQFNALAILAIDPGA